MLGVIENMAAGYQPDVIGQELRFSVSLVIILIVLLVLAVFGGIGFSRRGRL